MNNIELTSNERAALDFLIDNKSAFFAYERGLFISDEERYTMPIEARLGTFLGKNSNIALSELDTVRVDVLSDAFAASHYGQDINEYRAIVESENPMSIAD